MQYLVVMTAVVTATIVAAACERGAAPTGRPGATATPPSATVAETPSARPSATALTDRVWWRTDQGSAPGTMQVFLGNGTLISDSCFETYRLSSWRQDGDQVAWREDGIEIRARVASVDAGALVLQVHLPGGEEEQRFAAATVPYVCPDMPR
jgi:hypothetical protein